MGKMKELGGAMVPVYRISYIKPGDKPETFDLLSKEEADDMFAKMYAVSDRMIRTARLLGAEIEHYATEWDGGLGLAYDNGTPGAELFVVTLESLTVPVSEVNL